jgi:hypothetical protein
VTCPKCSEAAAHRSHRRGIKDYVLGQFSQIPYRCKKCGVRFYAYRAGEKSDKMRSPEERRIMKIRRAIKWKRSKREFAVYGIALMMIAVIVYWMTRQTIPSNG